MSKGFASNSRQLILATFVLLSFAGVGARLVWLHVIDRDSLLGFVSKARKKSIRFRLGAVTSWIPTARNSRRAVP